MDEAEADAVYNRLMDRLDRTIAILRRTDDEHWASWFADATRHIRAGDAYGLDLLLMAYGGMGSINDQLFDGRLRGLLSDIYDDASALRRDLNSG